MLCAPVKKLLLPTSLACLLLAMACNKDKDSDPFPTPQPTTANGYFSISYDSTKVRIDSMRTYYLNPSGILDSTLLVGVYSWKSPARRYDSGDSAYAGAKAWGANRSLGYGAAPIRFSDSAQFIHVSATQNSFTENRKTGFISTYGFRLK